MDRHGAERRQATTYAMPFFGGDDAREMRLYIILLRAAQIIELKLILLMVFHGCLSLDTNI